MTTLCFEWAYLIFRTCACSPWNLQFQAVGNWGPFLRFLQMANGIAQHGYLRTRVGLAFVLELRLLDLAFHHLRKRVAFSLLHYRVLRCQSSYLRARYAGFVFGCCFSVGLEKAEDSPSVAFFLGLAILPSLFPLPICCSGSILLNDLLLVSRRRLY